MFTDWTADTSHDTSGVSERRIDPNFIPVKGNSGLAEGCAAESSSDSRQPNDFSVGSGQSSPGRFLMLQKRRLKKTLPGQEENVLTGRAEGHQNSLMNTEPHVDHPASLHVLADYS